MPMYDLKCKKCGREFEAFARVHERNAQSCPACGAKCEVQVGKSSSFARITNAAWGMTGGRSLQFAFSDLAKTKRDLPSAEFDSTGALVYTSRAQQRRVMSEMRDTKKRVEEERAAKLERDVRNGKATRLPRSLIPDSVLRGLIK